VTDDTVTETEIVTRTGMLVETGQHPCLLDVHSSSSSEAQLRRMLGPSADGKGEAQAWLLSRLQNTILRLSVTTSWQDRLCRSIRQWTSQSTVILRMHCQGQAGTACLLHWVLPIVSITKT